jgi:hypothetical protein
MARIWPLFRCRFSGFAGGRRHVQASAKSVAAVLEQLITSGSSLWGVSSCEVFMIQLFISLFRIALLGLLAWYLVPINHYLAVGLAIFINCLYLINSHPPLSDRKLVKYLGITLSCVAVWLLISHGLNSPRDCLINVNHSIREIRQLESLESAAQTPEELSDIDALLARNHKLLVTGIEDAQLCLNRASAPLGYFDLAALVILGGLLLVPRQVLKAYEESEVA